MYALLTLEAIVASGGDGRTGGGDAIKALRAMETYIVKLAKDDRDLCAAAREHASPLLGIAPSRCGDALEAESRQGGGVLKKRARRFTKIQREEK